MQKSGADQDNWFFTQHISEEFDHSVHNYAVNITIEVIYALSSCRSGRGCDIGFRLLNYEINTQQLPSTTGSGYMNTENYEQFGRARHHSGYLEKYNFTLDPSDTGFYIAIWDVRNIKIESVPLHLSLTFGGTCLYPEAPAPVSVDVHFSCIDSASIPELESDTVTYICHSNGTWGIELYRTIFPYIYTNTISHYYARVISRDARSKRGFPILR